ACSRSAANLAFGSRGTILPPPARWSRYSRITRESNSVVPSSRISVGILPSGFCLRTASFGSVVSVASTLICFERPSRSAAMRTLRANGDGGADRRIIMGCTVRKYLRAGPRAATVGISPTRSRPGENRSPGAQSTGDHQVDGLGTLALLVGLDVELDTLSFGQRLQPGVFDCGDVHEHIASAVVRLDEAVAPL